VTGTDAKEKRLHIISGCNGVGKTTASLTTLPDMLHYKEFVNSDEIAKGLSPLMPADWSVSIEAGRVMKRRMLGLIARGETFALETTLASRSLVQVIESAHDRGYRVMLLYLWLDTPDLAMRRVRARRDAGGHFVEESIVRRRYVSGLLNLFDLYMSVSDEWAIMNSSTTPLTFIAKGNKKGEGEIVNEEVYHQIKRHYGQAKLVQDA
jgi:predicted ABC-type ATPase